MYISPFIAGILFTLAAQFGLMVIIGIGVAVFGNNKKKKKKGEEQNGNDQRNLKQ